MPTSAADAYLLVTPVRDEIDLLHGLVTTVRAQERRPSRWLLVDDGSVDGSAAALDELAARETWISVVHLRRPAHGGPARYAEVLGVGLQTVIELAEADGITAHFVANLDADVRCPPAMLAELVDRSAGDRMVGIASCMLSLVGDDPEGVPVPPLPCGSPPANLRLWRLACLEQVAFDPTPQWASVTALHARNRGWRTVVHGDLEAELVRPDASRGGWWSGWRRRGEAQWHVGLHPALVAQEAVRASARSHDLRGLALLAGYVGSAMRGRQRSRDPEVRDYFGSELPRARLHALLDRVPPLRRRRG